VTVIAYLAFDKDGFAMDKMFKPLARAIHWLDRYIFHVGYDPKLHSSYPGDSHFGVAFYLTAILLSILVAVIFEFSEFCLFFNSANSDSDNSKRPSMQTNHPCYLPLIIPVPPHHDKLIRL